MSHYHYRYISSDMVYLKITYQPHIPPSVSKTDTNTIHPMDPMDAVTMGKTYSIVLQGTSADEAKAEAEAEAKNHQTQ